MIIIMIIIIIMIMIIITVKFATPLNNMLAGVITSTLSSHPPEVSSEHVQRVTIEKTT
jgi:hypothetical protein